MAQALLAAAVNRQLAPDGDDQLRFGCLPAQLATAGGMTSNRVDGATAGTPRLRICPSTGRGPGYVPASSAEQLASRARRRGSGGAGRRPQCQSNCRGPTRVCASPVAGTRRIGSSPSIAQFARAQRFDYVIVGAASADDAIYPPVVAPGDQDDPNYAPRSSRVGSPPLPGRRTSSTSRPAGPGDGRTALGRLPPTGAAGAQRTS